MIDRKRYLFYPYSDQTYGFIKALLFTNKDIDIIAPIGAGLISKDMSYAVNRKEMKKIVKSIKDIGYKDYDTLIISSHINYPLCKNEICEIISNCKKEEIKVIYLGADAKIKELIEPTNKYPSDKLTSIKEIETMVLGYNELNLQLYTLQTPIAYIGGLLETIDSFDISLQMKLSMEKLGYTVSLVTREMDGKYFGGINYPNKFMKNTESVENQIISINRLIQAVDYLEKPDIILMDIPKGMIQYSNAFHNSFGIYTYMIAQTLPPDYLILTTPTTIMAKEYIDDINKHFSNTIGKKIDTLNITNAIYDIGVETSNTVGHPLYISEKDINRMVLENKGDYDLNMTNLNESLNIDILIKDIIEKFS